MTLRRSTPGVRNVPYGEVPEDTVRELLSEYGSRAARLARKLYAQQSTIRAYADLEDLVQVGRIAIVEAYVTYSPTKKCSFSSWVGSLIYWRLREISLESEVLSDDLQVAQESATHERVEFHQLWGALEEEISRLPPRMGTIVTRVMHGESKTSIGRSLGIGLSQTSYDFDRAIGLLRKRFIAREYDDWFTEASA